MYNFEHVIVEIPFTGSMNTWLNADGKPAYTSFNSFDEYKAARENIDIELKVVTADQFYQMLEQFWVSGFKEITYDQWQRAFEELPPLRERWINQTLYVFFQCEALSGIYHGLYLWDKPNEKYYCALQSVFSNDEKILELYSKII